MKLPWLKLSRKVRLMVMIILTFLFFMVEIVVGYVSNSNALIADAFHMISDVMALFIAFVSVHISPKTWSKNTFGFARAEVLGALTNAVFLMALSFTIFISSIQRFVEKEDIEKPLLVLAVGAIGLLMNLVGLCLFHEHGHSHGGGGGQSHGGHGHSHDDKPSDGGHGHSHDDKPSDEGHVQVDSKEAKPKEMVQKQGDSQMNIRGVFLHLMADALGSVIVIISALIVYYNDTWPYKAYVDPSLSILLVLIISCSTWPLLKESAYILLQTVPSHLEITALSDRLLSEVPEIGNIHDFHIWQLVATRVVASIHVQLPNNVQEDHMKNAKKIKDFFHREGIHSTTVQIEYANHGPSSNLKCDLPCPSLTEEDCSGIRCCPIPQKNPKSHIVIIRKTNLKDTTENLNS